MALPGAVLPIYQDPNAIGVQGTTSMQGGSGTANANPIPLAPVTTQATSISQPGAAAGGGGTTTQTTPAQTAAQLAAAQSTTDFNNGLNQANESTQNNINTAAGDYSTSISDYLAAQKASQTSLNANAVQNELARQQGLQGVRDMVGNGIQSGGVILSNDNAGTSSAGEALARAYGILGRQQASSVGNQAAQGQSKIDADQANLVAQQQQFQNVDNPQKKADTINGIVTNTQSQLAYLNQQAAYASIPDRVNIDQQIASVKANAMAALSAYDAQLSGGLSAIGPEGTPQVQADASRLAAAGTAPANQFNYTTAVPASLQDTGQFASDLPIFTGTQGKQTQSSLPLVT